MQNTALEQWTGLAGGVPPFDNLKVSDLTAAFDHAVAERRREIAVIVADPAPPTFDNVLRRLEDSGETLARVLTFYQVWCSTMKTDEVRVIQAKVEPMLARLGDEIIQNPVLFAKIQAVRDAGGHQGEDARLIEVHHQRFVLNGARLDAAAQARVAEINQRLATLGTEFEDVIMTEEARPALVITDPADLEGLPESFRAAARAEAERTGHPGHWVIANTRSSVEVFLSFAARRELRRCAFAAWTARGTKDNGPRIREILGLRTERARLFGFPSHAHWKLADKMLTDPADTLKLMTQVWTPALAKARADIAGLQTSIDREGGGFTLAPWDHRYYAERERRARFDLDPNAVRPYMRFERVRDAMFSVATRLYGLAFTPVDVPVYHADVGAYRVDRAGEMVGLFYLDPYARPGKSSGAWMSHFRKQRYVERERVLPIVSNASNFVRAGAGQPIDLSWDDARTLFHEFGHGLHGLLSDVRHPHLQGTSVATDYVEFPSHFHENYLRTDHVLAQLVNDRGEAMPRELIAKINRADTFNLAFATVEFLGNAILDMRLHLLTEVDDPVAATDAILREIGMPREIALRHGLHHFAHAFNGDHYSAGYYSYLWSDVMASDGFAAFTEAGDPYDPAVAQRLRDFVLSVGNTLVPAEGYRKFRGRDPDVGALLRARGLVAGEQA